MFNPHVFYIYMYVLIIFNTDQTVDWKLEDEWLSVLSSIQC